MSRGHGLCLILAGAIPALLIAAAVTNSFTRASTPRQALTRMIYILGIAVGFACALAGATDAEPGRWQVAGAEIAVIFGFTAAIGGLVDEWADVIVARWKQPAQRVGRLGMQGLAFLAVAAPLLLVLRSLF